MKHVIWEEIPTYVNHDKKIVVYTPVKSGHSTIKHLLLDNGYTLITKKEHIINPDDHLTDDYSTCDFYRLIWKDKPYPWMEAENNEEKFIKPLTYCLNLEEYTSYMTVRHPVSRFISGLFTELDHSSVTMLQNYACDETIDYNDKIPKMANMFSSLIHHFWQGNLDRIILPNKSGQFASHCWILCREFYKEKSIYDTVDHLLPFDTSREENSSDVIIDNVKNLKREGIIDEINEHIDYKQNPSKGAMYDALAEAMTPGFIEEMESILIEEMIHIKVNENKFVGRRSDSPLFHLLASMEEHPDHFEDIKEE